MLIVCAWCMDLSVYVMHMHIMYVCALIIHSARTHSNVLCASCIHVYIWIMHVSYVLSAVNYSLYPANRCEEV